jgi:hypothetical protein
MVYTSKYLMSQIIPANVSACCVPGLAAANLTEHLFRVNRFVPNIDISSFESLVRTKYEKINPLIQVHNTWKLWLTV